MRRRVSPPRTASAARISAGQTTPTGPLASTPSPAQAPAMTAEAQARRPAEPTAAWTAPSVVAVSRRSIWIERADQKTPNVVATSAAAIPARRRPAVRATSA